MQICNQLLLPAELRSITSEGLHRLRLESALQASYGLDCPI